jgi:hypothetical protein
VKKKRLETEKMRLGLSFTIQLFVIILPLIAAVFTITTNNNSALAQENNNNTNANKTSSPSFSAANTSSTQDIIPTAESVYQSQSMTLPSSVGTFVWYIVNEAHENSANEKHKYISDHNPIYLPTNLKILQGTAISFLDADAPWDTPHPHTINIIDSSGKIVYTTGKLDYTNASTPVVLPSGKYSVLDTKYTWMVGNLIVSTSQKSIGNNLVIGGFYTPTNQVANNKDNDGGVHPGWLGYYKEQFPKNGFKILSTFNFHYATCKYCPGQYWPDQKTADHTLIIYSTTQPIADVLRKLSKMVWDNVYI